MNVHVLGLDEGCCCEGEVDRLETHDGGGAAMLDVLYRCVDVVLRYCKFGRWFPVDSKYRERRVEKGRRDTELL